jgi:hypothetical protein
VKATVGYTTVNAYGTGTIIIDAAAPIIHHASAKAAARADNQKEMPASFLARRDIHY